MMRVVLIAALAVLVLDTVGSYASAAWGLSYTSLSLVSLLIYATAGFFATRYGGMSAAAVAGGLAGLVDATLGWALAWAIGPGRPPDGYTGITPILFAAAAVVVTGGVLGVGGALIARLTRRRSRADA